MALLPCYLSSFLIVWKNLGAPQYLRPYINYVFTEVCLGEAWAHKKKASNILTFTYQFMYNIATAVVITNSCFSHTIKQKSLEKQPLHFLFLDRHNHDSKACGNSSAFDCIYLCIKMSGWALYWERTVALLWNAFSWKGGLHKPSWKAV